MTCERDISALSQILFWLEIPKQELHDDQVVDSEKSILPRLLSRNEFFSGHASQRLYCDLADPAAHFDEESGTCLLFGTAFDY